MEGFRRIPPTPRFATRCVTSRQIRQAGLAHRVRLEIFVDGTVTQMIFGAFGAMLVMFTTILIYAVSGQRPFHFGYALLRLIGSGLLGMLTLPFVSLTMNKLESILPKQRGYGWQ